MLRLLLLFVILPIVHCDCPDGFKLVAGGQCVLETPYTLNSRWDQIFDTSISKCKEKHAQPVIIHYAEQNSYFAGQYNGDYIPLGLVCNTTSLKWQWVDESPVDYKPSYYDSSLNSNCKSGYVWYMLYTTGNWYSVNTSSYNNFDIFCTFQLPQPIYSEDGCEYFDDDIDDGVCYQVANIVQNWQEAQIICRSFGADVSSVHNLKENSFLRRLAISNGALNGIYLGATLSGKGNEFGWIDGSQWDYDNFFPGFPMASLGDCLVMDTDGTSGQWTNVDCSSKLSVACTKSQKYSPPTCTTGPWKEGQIIFSPGYPFDAATPCDYLLEVDAGKRVELEIISLEANPCCDYVTIIENYFGGNFLANLTGEIERKLITTSSSNFMRVSWQPNGGVNVRGMMMSFRGV